MSLILCARQLWGSVHFSQIGHLNIQHNIIIKPISVIERERKLLSEKYGFPSEYQIYVTPIQELTEKINEEDMAALIELQTLRNTIRQYDGMISLNISKEYIQKRGFSEFKALREIIQNSLDETELPTGVPDVTIKIDEMGTWIIDNGRGLNGNAFIIGNSEKECWMRGYYGEGLKLALGFFLLVGYSVYIFSNKNVFKPVFLPVKKEKAWLNILLGEGANSEKGTRILIANYKADKKMLDELVSFQNQDINDKIVDRIVMKGKECDYEKPLTIYDYPNLLYMRNLLVGKANEVTKRRSFFTYDLWWFRLDVSRNLLTYSMPALFVQVASAIEKSEKFRKAFAKKIVEAEMIRVSQKYGGKIIEFCPQFSTFEGHLFVFAFPKKLLKHILSEIGLEDKEEAIEFFTREKSSDQDIRRAISDGKIPFVSTSEIRGPIQEQLT